MKRIKDVMTPHAKSISPETSLVAAAIIMRDLNVGSLPVCEDNFVIGIVTDRDLTIRGLAGLSNPEITPVRSIMSEDVACVFAGQDAEEAARIMELKQVRRLPVLNLDNELVGIVSLGDLAASTDVQLLAEALQMISEPSHA
jgi:CBS domain-containing protein